MSISPWCFKVSSKANLTNQFLPISDLNTIPHDKSFPVILETKYNSTGQFLLVISETLNTILHVNFSL